MPNSAPDPRRGRRPHRLTEDQKQARAHLALRQTLDDYDAGRLSHDPWTSLHLCLALSVMVYRLFPVAELYVERARLPHDRRPHRTIDLPARWPQLVDELRQELGLARGPSASGA